MTDLFEGETIELDENEIAECSECLGDIDDHYETCSQSDNNQKDEEMTEIVLPSADFETHASEELLNAILEFSENTDNEIDPPAEYVVTVTPNMRKGNFVGWNVTIVNPAGEFVTSRSYLNPTIDDRDAAMKAINSARLDGFGFYFSGNDGEFRFTE